VKKVSTRADEGLAQSFFVFSWRFTDDRNATNAVSD
jgi:hypothetical protein